MARARASKWGQMGFGELVHESAVKDIEAKYLPNEQQRDYDGTWGHETTLQKD